MEYIQKVIWLGTVLGESTTQEFEKFFKDELGFNVKFDTEFEMVGEYDGIHAILFKLASEDIPKFAMFRLTTGDMKWFEDWVDNHKDSIPDEIYEQNADYLKD